MQATQFGCRLQVARNEAGYVKITYNRRDFDQSDNTASGYDEHTFADDTASVLKRQELQVVCMPPGQNAARGTALMLIRGPIILMRLSICRDHDTLAVGRHFTAAYFTAL